MKIEIITNEQTIKLEADLNEVKEIIDVFNPVKINTDVKINSDTLADEVINELNKRSNLHHGGIIKK